MKTYQNNIVKCKGIKIVKHDESKTYVEREGEKKKGCINNRNKGRSCEAEIRTTGEIKHSVSDEPRKRTHHFHCLEQSGDREARQHAAGQSSSG